MNKKSIIKIVIILVLVIIASIFIYFGIHFAKLTNPEYLVDLGIDKLDEKITNYTKLNSKYNLGDTFSVTGNLSFNLDSEDYLKKSKNDKEYKEKYNTIKNLSKTTNKISFAQDKSDKKALFEIHSLIGEEKLIDYKYLIENATSYYYLEDVLKKYVNNGTSNYFEMYSDGSTTYQNMEYIHKTIIEALKNNLNKDYIEKYNKKENIDGKQTAVNQISIRLDDKKMHKLLNSIISDLKKDDRANKIITGYYPDFKKYKIKSSKTILESQETYTINLYTTKLLGNILKYEVVHLKGDEKKSYIYEGNQSRGHFYYIDADTIIYSIDIKDDGEIVEADIKDSKNDKIGEFKLENEEDNMYFTLNFDDGTKKRDVIYSSKYSDYKKGKSFTNEKKLSFKYIDNKVSILSGDVVFNYKAENTSNINEDTSEAVLKSTLSDEVNNKFKNKKDKVKERLKK